MTALLRHLFPLPPHVPCQSYIVAEGLLLLQKLLGASDPLPPISTLQSEPGQHPLTSAFSDAFVEHSSTCPLTSSPHPTLAPTSMTPGEGTRLDSSILDDTVGSQML